MVSGWMACIGPRIGLPNKVVICSHRRKEGGKLDFSRVTANPIRLIGACHGNCGTHYLIRILTGTFHGGSKDCHYPQAW